MNETLSNDEYAQTLNQLLDSYKNKDQVIVVNNWYSPKLINPR